MEEEKYQKELFKFEKPKRLFPKLISIFPKADFEGKVLITFTLERVIFISIGIIMLMVIVYAMGVEKGKSVDKVSIVSSAKVQPERLSQSQPVKAQVLIAKPIAPAPESIRDVGKPYTIVAVTFTRKDTAAQEVNYLKKEGFDATVVQSDSYLLVCIGAYPDKNSSQSKMALSKVRKIHKDAYFKLR